MVGLSDLSLDEVDICGLYLKMEELTIFIQYFPNIVAL